MLTTKRTKQEAIDAYDKYLTEEPVSGKPWIKLTYGDVAITPPCSVEIPQFAGHIVRRAIRILFFNSDEGP